MYVTNVLRVRIGEPAVLERMAILSLAAHVVVFGTFMLAPGNWLLSQTAGNPARVMSITLGGGGEGPQNGGLTPMGGRPGQNEKPPHAPRETGPPPAAAAPEVTGPPTGAEAATAASRRRKP